MGVLAFAGKRSPRFKWLIRAGIAFAIYVLAGFFLVPAIIKWQMLKRLPAITKRQAAIQQVKFNPLVLSLTIHGLALTEPDGSVFVSFDEFYANFQLSSLFRWKWTFAEISLKKPFAQVTYRDDGTFNFANLLDTTPKPQTQPKGPQPPPPLLVYRLSITNGAVAFADLKRQVPFQTKFAPIDVEFTRFTTIRDRNSPYSFIAKTSEGEVFAWSGDVSANPVRSAGTFRLGNLRLPKYAPYARDYARFQIAGGLVDVAADYRMDAGTNALELDVSNTVVYLHQLALKAPDSDETVISIPSLSVEKTDASLENQTAHVGLIKSTGGSILARREKDGSINLLANLILPPKQTNDIANTNQVTPPPWIAKIDEITFDNYSVKVEDDQPEKPASFGIDQLGFTLKGVSNQSNSPIAATLALRFQETGYIGAEGKLTLMPPCADMQLTMSNVDLRPAQPYIQGLAKLVLNGGALDLHGRALYASPGPGAPLAHFEGDLAVNQLATADDVLYKDFTKWTSFTMDGVKVDVQPEKLEVDQMKFTGLEAGVVIGPDHRINLQTILRQGDTNATPPAPASKPAEPAAPMQLPDISIHTVALENSSLHFSDQSLEPHCSFTVEQFGGTIQGLATRGDITANVDVKGKVDDRSPFSVTGKIKPQMDNLFADVTMAVTNTELTAFTPYTEKFAGHPLEKGKLSFAVHYTLNKQMEIDSQNAFFIDQLTLGPRNNSPDATKLPVKLAVALLKDRNGRIQMEVPVKGKVNDPKFAYGPIIWHVIENLLVKAATSPFSLLGAAFGGGGEELSYVDFQPGQAAFVGTETNKLEKLAKALYERPALSLEITGQVDPATDREALARVRMDEQVKANWLKDQSDSNRTNTTVDQVKLDPKTYERYVRKTYRAFIGSYHPTEPATNAATNGTTAANSPTQPARAIVQPISDTGASEHGAAQLINRTAAPKRAKIVRTSIVRNVAPNAPAVPIELTPREAELLDMEDQLAKRIQITEDDLRDLMQARANKVQSWLLKTDKITADRLFIIAPKPISPTAKGESRVKLSLD